MPSRTTTLRHTLRRLSREPWFSATIILMLAFGIGASATIFSLIEGILLRPLPFHDPGRLVQLGEHVGAGPNISAAARDLRTYSAQSTAFSSVSGFIGTAFELSGGATPEI